MTFPVNCERCRFEHRVAACASPMFLPNASRFSAPRNMDPLRTRSATTTLVWTKSTALQLWVKYEWLISHMQPLTSRVLGLNFWDANFSGKQQVRTFCLKSSSQEVRLPRISFSRIAGWTQSPVCRTQDPPGGEHSLRHAVARDGPGRVGVSNSAVSQNHWHHFGVGAPPILEPTCVGIGMFTGATGFSPMAIWIPVVHWTPGFGSFASLLLGGIYGITCWFGALPC